jgi:FtsZ-binding cell division protein ZapB
LLLQEVDNLKRKESYYSQETESLRKVNESLQQELDSVRKAPGVEDIGKVLTLEQENQELRAELDELRD